MLSWESGVAMLHPNIWKLYFWQICHQLILLCHKLKWSNPDVGGGNVMRWCSSTCSSSSSSSNAIWQNDKQASFFGPMTRCSDRQAEYFSCIYYIVVSRKMWQHRRAPGSCLEDCVFKLYYGSVLVSWTPKVCGPIYCHDT